MEEERASEVEKLKNLKGTIEGLFELSAERNLDHLAQQSGYDRDDG